MRISTRVPGFEASGRIIGARNWLHESVAGSNPKIEPDDSVQADPAFEKLNRGVSITVRFDDSTHPRRLDWIKANNAEKWSKILAVKTGLGSIVADPKVAVEITVVSEGKMTVYAPQGTAYLWLHKSANKTARVRDVEAAAKVLFEKYGAGRALPDKFRNLDFVYDSWTADEINTLVGHSLDPEEKEVLQKHKPSISVEFGYTAKLWTRFNESLELRAGYKVLSSGIQLAANNMPQGEPIIIPLTRNIGRQNQLHYLIHFDDYSPDMGRKGFHRELTDFAKSVARIITESHLVKLRHLLKANTGVAPDLVREMKINDWKKDMLVHEQKMPLTLSSEHFFKPTERVSITSKPTREQDVIALFNQLLAGGVIRGISVMSTNERFTYDGLFKIVFDLEKEIYTFDPVENPLGVSLEIADALHGRITDPQVLEYKYSLDGLIEDLDGQDKNIGDINLCICWEVGDVYKEIYGITSLLIPENSDQRQYHGVTHVLTDLESGAKLCDLIVLAELVDSLNEPELTAVAQREKYE